MTIMKLSVSTLGCPQWTLEEILSRCKAYGYDAIELRGVGSELDVTKTEHFCTPSAIAQTRQKIADAGLAVSAIDTSVRLADEVNLPKHMDEGRAAIDLAAKLGAPFIRVFGGEIPEGEDYPTAISRVMDGMRQ